MARKEERGKRAFFLANFFPIFILIEKEKEGCPSDGSEKNLQESEWNSKDGKTATNGSLNLLSKHVRQN